MSHTQRAARLVALILILVPSAWGRRSQAPAWKAAADGRDGQTWAGHLVADDDGSLRFETEDLARNLPLDRLARVRLDPELAAGRSEAPPFALNFSLDQRLSGRLEAIDEDVVTLRLAEGREPIVIERAAVTALVQKPGEALVLTESFDRLDPQRWSEIEGRVQAEPTADRPDNPALRLQGEDASARIALPDAVEAGRLALDFLHRNEVVEGNHFRLDLVFEGPVGAEVLRIELGWDEPFPVVESRGGPSLLVQPLVAEAGWRRLTARFGNDRTLLTIDGDELARGAGPSGPLSEVRISKSTARRAEAPEDLEAVIDDLNIYRTFEPTTSAEVDPQQDEVRLTSGDQVWGRLLKGDAEALEFGVLGRAMRFPWSRVSGLYPKRTAVPSAPLEGRFVAVEWASGGSREGLDRLEGAARGLQGDAFTFEVPYARSGPIAVPMDWVRRIEPLFEGRRIVLDPFPRHLGDQYMPELDPPLPDGDRHELAFELDRAPDAPARLAIDVVQLEGEYEDGRFVEELRNGELRTTVRLNGEAFDYLNRYVEDANRRPARIEVPIPRGLLRAGANRLEFRQTGREDRPEDRDDLGLLRVAIEWPAADQNGP